MKHSTPTCLLVLLAACGDPSPQWSPERAVPAGQRNLQWDASTRDRLGLGGSADEPAGWSATVPVGWEELPADPARFRHALWRVRGQPETECYLTVGVGGGLTTNCSRWYGQFGQTAPDAAALAALPPAALLGKQGHLIELQGTYSAGGKAKADFAALLVFTAEGDRVNSVKFTGPAAVVTAERDAFLALVASIRAGAAKPPVAGNEAPVAAPAAAPSAPADYEAQAPAAWQAVAGSTRQLHYRIGADTEIYLSGMSGDLRPMLDIWRSEMGQPPLDDAGFAGLPKTPLLGGEAMLLDLQGDWQSMSGRKLSGARMLLAAGKQGDAITFVKCCGPAAEVAAQRDAILQFLGSIRRRGS